jgi:nucleoid-associated protein YgaU
LVHELIKTVGRRVHRAGRLIQGADRKVSLDDLRPVGSFAFVVGASVMIVSFVAQATNPAPTTPTVVPVESVAYLLDELRPSLEDPDTSFIPEPTSYTVAEGDTLLDIAFKFGSTVEAIRLASNLKNADMLSIGQELVVPPRGAFCSP